MILVAGGVQGDGEAARSSGGLVLVAVGHRCPQRLVAGQQGVDFLVNALRVRARRTRPPRTVDFSSRKAVSISQRRL